MAKILIVDDEESIRFSFALMLTDAGHRVFNAQDPVEARAILESGNFDVAIVDRFLSSDDGMALIEYINKKYPLCATILISAYPFFQSACESFKHKLFAYLQKPVKTKELCKIIEEAEKYKNSKRKGLYEDF